MPSSYLITGGAGFIGTNVAHYYLTQGQRVTIFDNLSRKGSRANLRWLKQCHGDRLRVVVGDIRQLDNAFSALLEEAEVVFHLAGQVAVATSVDNPREDFEVNALGTFNLLEAIRLSRSRPIVIYSSTNKVYGKMADLHVTERQTRYSYGALPEGVSESRPLDFHSPYGCSKGTADQYVIDFARIYGLKTIVFRQSCIYGPHQFGMEEQGWIAWFAIRAMHGLPVTIYGDGKQVRDVLYVDDLVAAYDAAIERIRDTWGRSYNIGGGPKNTLSVLELMALLEEELGLHLEHRFAEWRPGDQFVFVSDIRRAQTELGWQPRVRPSEGLRGLLDWLGQNSHLCRPTAARRRSL